jgi:septum formation protein
MTNPEHTASTLHPLVLASNSPRRRELLAEAGYRFTVMPPDEDVECGVCSETGPAGLVAELAFRKAGAVVQKLQKDSAYCQGLTPGSPVPIVLAADTVAECDGMILGKPRDEGDARTMLTKLIGREHRVFSGVCLWPTDVVRGSPDPARSEPLGQACGSVGRPATTAGLVVRVAVTRLRMDHLTDAQLSEYLASGQWEGKAGAFGYQDRLGWVHVIEGSESNVVGLPLEMLAEILS